jgi:autotransporter-associated beta strand protein
MKQNSSAVESKRRGGGWKLEAIAAGVMLAVSSGQASQLTWDAGNTNNGAQIDPADGSWSTSTDLLNWNNGSGNVPWTQTSTTVGINGAVFGGADGTYEVTVTGQVAVTNLTFLNSGYTLSGASGTYIPALASINVAAGVMATINCPVPTGNNAINWTVGAGGTLVVGGNIGGMQPKFQGAGTYYLGGFNTPSVTYILAPVYVTNGSYTAGASFFVGYPANGYNTGTFTLDGPATTFSHTGGDSIVARGGGTGTFIIRNGATANIGPSALRNLRIAYDNNAGDHGTVDVQGGTLNVGNASVLGQIIFGGNGAPTGQTTVMTQEGGTINAYGGMTFGGTAGGAGGTASLILSGGNLYLGPVGISEGTIHPTETIILSGGTVGALANWSSALPMTLATVNGDVTFQCADPYTTPYNISLSGAMAGAGGLRKTGGGILTLSGPNTYAGATVVSNGTLVIVAHATASNGPVTLDGSAGSATLTVQVPNTGQYWSVGDLTFNAGTLTADFEYGVLPPSTTLAPLQVSGSVAFTVTPSVTVGGSAIAAGTYPLVQYTGTVSGATPASVNLSGGYASGYVTNITASKTIALVVTSSTYFPAIAWGMGNGVWDINTTANWTQYGSAVKYADGNAVVFDDTASGTSPITVTLNSTANPLSITANNAAKGYIINGTGTIAGPASLTLLGSGTVTLSGTNTYSGGTTLSAGQLNINNGDASGTAIGLGPLTIHAGATIDNTSGADVTLRASIPEYWNGNFTYLGSSNSFNTGPGTVTLGGSLAIAANAHTFTVGSSIYDNGLNYTLTKIGNGALTLPVANYFGSPAGGGLTLSAGLLNVGDPGSVGYGTLTIDGGSIDNISGQDLTLTPPAILFGPGFTFVGTTNLDLGTAAITFDTAAGTPVVIDVVSNTLTFEGALTLGNNTLVKNGNGTLSMSGSIADGGVPLTVNAGRVNLDKSFGNAIGLAPVGVTVNTNGLLVITGTSGDQIHDSSGSLTPVRLVSGVFDLNGQSERVDVLTISDGGTLRNSASNSVSALTLIPASALTLANANSLFDVTAVDGELDINSLVTGAGSLVKTGLGVLNLNSNNTYTGNTTVSGGTLILNYPCLANTATVTVATNAMLELNFAETNTVAALVLNGVSQLAGLYDATKVPACLAGTGSLQVVPGIPSSPTNITFSVSGNTLSLSWPSNYVGWILQTNVINVGVSNDWYNVPGSETNTQLTFPMDNPAITNEFFRLLHP